jgi:type I restriction enzyme S subunit
MSWETDTLSNNAKVISGFAFKSDSFRTDKGVPIIKIKNIQREYVEIDGEYFVEDSFLSLDPKYHCVKSDILISLTGSHITLPNSVVGRVAKYHYDFTSLLNQRGGKIVVTNPKKLWNDYLYYFLCQNEIRIKLAQFGRGGANQCNISPSNVESIPIILPPLQTQKRISSILSAYDDLIENNLKRIKLLEETAQNIYKEWFVNFRFPNYVNTPINQETGLPEGWEKGLADDTYNINIGKTPPRGETQWFSVQEGIKWVSIADMNKSSVFISQTNERITKDGVDKFNMRLANEGSVLLSFKLTVGAVVIASEEVVTNEAIAHFNMLEDSVLSKEYTYCFLKNFNYQSLGSTSSIGTSINSKIVKSMIIVIPTENLISDFTLRVRGVFTQIQNLTFQNQKLKEARDILLPRLLNRTIEV